MGPADSKRTLNGLATRTQLHSYDIDLSGSEGQRQKKTHKHQPRQGKGENLPTLAEPQGRHARDSQRL